MSNLHKSIFKLKQSFFCSDKDATGTKSKGVTYPYYRLDDIYLNIRKTIKKLKLDLDFSFISNIIDNKHTLSLVFYSPDEEKIVSTQFLSTFNDILLNDTEMLRIKAEKTSNAEQLKPIAFAINSPHNFGSIRTYTKKYMLLDFFCILDAKDDDARSWNQELEELEKRKEIDLKNEIKDILEKEKNLQTAESINQYLAKNYSKHYNSKN